MFIARNHYGTMAAKGCARVHRRLFVGAQACTSRQAYCIYYGRGIIYHSPSGYNHRFVSLIYNEPLLGSPFSKHKCCSNVGPASTTLAQHWNNIGRCLVFSWRWMPSIDNPSNTITYSANAGPLRRKNNRFNVSLHWNCDIGLILGRRRRRWTNIRPPLGKYLVSNRVVKPDGSRVGCARKRVVQE